MKTPTEIERVQHVEYFVRRILEFTNNKSYNEFLGHNLNDAVHYCLSIIEEASKYVSPLFQSKYSNVDWDKIVGMKKRFIPEYDQVHNKDLWAFILKELPGTHINLNDVLKRENVEPLKHLREELRGNTNS